MEIKFKYLVLLLTSACVVLYGVECRGGRSGGGRGGFGRSGGHSSGSRSWGSSWSSSGRHAYPSSGGLSGGGSHSHPSHTGLSGSGSRSSGTHSYPSNTGLSGFGSGTSGTHSYPSNTGLSGFGSGTGGTHSYPSNTGLSGFGFGSGSTGTHSYPSNTGLSGFGSGSSGGSRFNQRPSYPSYTGVHSYDSNSRHNSKPSNTWNTYSPGNHYGYGHGSPHIPYTYHTAPQTVYIQQYRDTGSRYSDILTGLALYNMGRSHSHHYHSYYEDDYYRRQYYDSSSGSYRHPYNAPNERAKCFLRITDDAKEQKLSIPCEIVSTFSTESEKVDAAQLLVDGTAVVCKNVTSSSNFTLPVNSTILNITMISSTINQPYDIFNAAHLNATSQSGNDTSLPTNETALLRNETLIPRNETSQLRNETLLPSNETPLLINETSLLRNETSLPSKTTLPDLGSTSLNYTICMNVTTVNGTDPLTQKGPKLEITSKMKCIVEIQTTTSVLRNNVDCKTLQAYAKMPEPKDQSPLVPKRSTLKTWLNSPPWWLSMFIAV